MRKRSVACLCLLLIAMVLLSACDVASDDPANTPVPQMTAGPIPTPQPPDEDDPNEDDPYVDEDNPSADEDDPFALEGDDDTYDEYGDSDEYVEDDSQDTAGEMLANAGVAAAGPGLPMTPEPTPSATPYVRPTIDPSEKPIAVDPLDKPTQVPLSISYIKYESSPMGISFDRPAGWKEYNPADSNVQFTEPESGARNGYRARLTVRVVQKGAKQEKSNAQALLEEVMEELKMDSMWTEFNYNPPQTASLGNAGGYYTYYTAIYNGVKLKGRIIVVARGNALYMVRITSTDEFYSLYETIYRQVRSSWSFSSD